MFCSCYFAFHLSSGMALDSEHYHIILNKDIYSLAIFFFRLVCF